MTAALIDVKTAPDIRDVVHRAVQALAEGKLVVFPTETVYGVAASALDTSALDRLVSIKGPDGTLPLTLAVKSAEEAADYVPALGTLGGRLARRCWPGPVTLVLPDSDPNSLRRQLPERVQQMLVSDGRIGLRVPAHSLILESLRLLPGPVVLTSCSRNGDPVCATAQSAQDCVGETVDMILDDGPCQFGQPSSVVEVRVDSLEMLREGVVSAATLQRLASCIILFVCTGNTCRSPMAQELARKCLAELIGCKVDELEDRGYSIASAGIAAMAGGRATAEAIQVMEERGVDLQRHVSQPLSDRLVRFADLILTMTHGHRQALLEQWPEAAERIRLVSADQTDVSDPIGGSIDMYRRCASQLEVALRPHLMTLLEARPHSDSTDARKEK